MTDYRIEAATKEEWAERALRAEAKLAWQPIETAPSENHVLHIRSLWVYSALTGSALYFDMCAGYLENGDFISPSGDNCGWRPEDYTHWMPLPAPPSQN